MSVLMVNDRVWWIDRDGELGDWLGTVTASKIGDTHVTVKLDVGGTFQVPREDLQLAEERKQ